MIPKHTVLFFTFLACCYAGLAQTQSAPQTAASGQTATVATPVIVIRGALSKGLNSKTAQPGQTFAVKTAEPLKLSNGTEIPAGSDLSGHVVQASARANGAADSTLTLTFDTLQPKGSTTALPIRAIVQAIAPPLPAPVSAPVVGDMRTETAGGGPTGARISSDKIYGDHTTGAASRELTERSAGVLGIKNMTLTAGPVNGVDGSMFYSADKSVKLEDGSQVMVRIALKQ